jgi:putative ABC transport system permease protein
MKQWLQQFAYRTEMKWWMFAVSAALVLTIAIIAVGGQVLKSALRNPVKSLKITSD